MPAALSAPVMPTSSLTGSPSKQSSSWRYIPPSSPIVGRGIEGECAVDGLLDAVASPMHVCVWTFGAAWSAPLMLVG